MNLLVYHCVLLRKDNYHHMHVENLSRKSMKTMLLSKEVIFINFKKVSKSTFHAKIYNENNLH